MLDEEYSGIFTKVVVNKTNKGIHESRVIGIEDSIYDWILIIDQDDEVTNNAFEVLAKNAFDCELVVGNGICKFNNGDRTVFKNIVEMKYIIKEEMFLKSRNYIRTPGQCLIKKQYIPDNWKTNILKSNGCDDYYLWLMMLNNNVKIHISPEVVLIHHEEHGTNLSNNCETIRDSNLEMLSLLKNNGHNNKKIKQLKSSIMFRYYQETNKIMLIRYPESILFCAIKYLTRKLHALLYNIRREID